MHDADYRCIHTSTEGQVGIIRNLLRSVLVLSTVTVAIQAPYFGSVMGAVGGFTDALQCFVFPPLIYLTLEKDLVHASYRVYALGIVMVGVGVMVYTFLSTLRDVCFAFRQD
jgi:amino acid permease